MVKFSIFEFAGVLMQMIKRSDNPVVGRSRMKKIVEISTLDV